MLFLPNALVLARLAITGTKLEERGGYRNGVAGKDTCDVNAVFDFALWDRSRFLNKLPDCKCFGDVNAFASNVYISLGATRLASRIPKEMRVFVRRQLRNG